MEKALSLAHAAFAFAWAKRPEARCHGLPRDAAATACRETRQLRHVAACLRPQAVRAASRSACHELPILRDSSCACIHFRMGAAARGAQTRPAARRDRHATGCVPPAAGRACCVSQRVPMADHAARLALRLHSLLHGLCGQRRAVTACRETRQARHVAACLRLWARRCHLADACGVPCPIPCFRVKQILP